MKKLYSIVFIFGLLVFSFHLLPVIAEYEVILDPVDKKVYLVSGDTKISVDNVNEYFSGDSGFKTQDSSGT